MTLATSVFIVISWALSAVFVLNYGLGAPWYRSVFGRHFFLFGVILLEITSLATLSTLFGADWVGRPAVRLAVWAQVAGILFWRVQILLRAQFSKGSEDGSEERHSPESAHG